MRICIAALVVSVFASSAALPEESRVKITSGVWAAFQEYLKELPEGGDGLFVVSQDGRRYGSYVCKKGDCGSLGTMIVRAVTQCVDSEQSCDLFARRRDIVVSYEISK